MSIQSARELHTQPHLSLRIVVRGTAYAVTRRKERSFGRKRFKSETEKAFYMVQGKDL